MAEELQLNVKTNIKSATKDTKEYVSELEKAQTGVSDLSENLKIQDNVIRDLEKAVQRLEMRLLSIPKGAMGWSEMNKILKETKLELKGEKDAVKELKSEMKEAEDQLKKVETATSKVKTETKGLKTETEKYTDKLKANKSEMKGLIDNFGAFGLTIGNLKKKFKDVGLIMKTGLKGVGIQISGVLRSFQLLFSGKMRGAAKLLFTVIKTGIAATGIGLLVSAFGSLVTWLATTKKGAETLQKVFIGLGAAISVITDRIIKFGGSIVKFFKGDFKGAAADIKGTFAGIGEEIKDNVIAAVKLKAALQELRDSERELKVETAERRAEIEKLKLISQDITESDKDRIEAAKEAFKLENELEAKRVENAQKAVDLEKARHDTISVTADDLDALAQLEINLANIQRESGKKQIFLNNKINQIKDETIRKNKEIKRQEEEIRVATLTMLQQIAVAEQETAYAKAIQLLVFEKEKEIAIANEIKNEEDRTARLKAINDLYAIKFIEASNLATVTLVENNKIVSDSEAALVRATGQAIGNLGALFEEGSDASKAAALTQIAINTALGFMQGLDIAQKSAAATGPGAALAFPIFYMSQVAAILGALGSAKQALGGGGETSGMSSTAPSATVETPAPQMVGGQFEITNPVPEQDPIKAFVVTDEMTNSQDQLANIRRRATI